MAVPETEENPVIALAPPLDQTPTFPTMVLVGTLVTVSAPRTVKLAKSGPSNGVAPTGETLQIPTSARADNDFNELTLRVVLICLCAFLMMISLRGITTELRKLGELTRSHPISNIHTARN